MLQTTKTNTLRILPLLLLLLRHRKRLWCELEEGKNHQQKQTTVYLSCPCRSEMRKTQTQPTFTSRCNLSDVVLYQYFKSLLLGNIPKIRFHTLRVMENRNFPSSIRKFAVPQLVCKNCSLCMNFMNLHAAWPWETNRPPFSVACILQNSWQSNTTSSLRHVNKTRVFQTTNSS